LNLKEEEKVQIRKYLENDVFEGLGDLACKEKKHQKAVYKATFYWYVRVL